MDIVILTAVWKRPEVFKIWKHCIEQLNVDVVVVGSEGSRSKKMCSGFDYVECPNQPLSRKWNLGLMHLAKRHKFEYVLILGSDDLICKNYIDTFKPHLTKDLVGRLDSYQYDLVRQRCGYFSGYKNHRKGETVGAGRFISRGAIRRLNHMLWRPGLSSSLDYSMMQNLKGASRKALNIKDMNVMGVGIKGHHVMNKYNPHVPQPTDTVLSHFDSTTVDMIKGF